MQHYFSGAMNPYYNSQVDLMSHENEVVPQDRKTIVGTMSQKMNDVFMV